MTFPTFSPPRNPDVNSGMEERPDIMAVRLGDGYSVRSPKGINSRAAQMQVSWRGIKLADKNSLVGFFQTQNGYLPFYYQFPGEAATKKWICPEWGWKALAYDIYSVTAVFLQVFDPDV